MKRLLSFLLIPITAIGIFSCDILDQDAPLPGYIYVNNIRFQRENTTKTGYGRINITDAWFYIDGVRKGVFETPTEIAVNEQRSFEVDIQAGIKKNGISSTRINYPFYTTWSAPNPIEVSDMNQVSLTPVVKYKSDCEFPLLEGFESSVIALDSVSGSDVNIERLPIEENEASQRYVGSVTLTSDAPGLKLVSSKSMELPIGADNPTYLELDYNCNQMFVISVISDYASGADVENQVIFLNPTDKDANGEHEWNKIYVELTPTVSAQFDAQGYQIAFTAYYDDNLGSENGKILLDNIKVVHR